MRIRHVPSGFGMPIVVAAFAAWAATLLLAAFVGATPLHDPLCHNIAQPHGYDCAAVRLLPAAALQPGDLVDRAGGRAGAMDSAACRIPGAASLPFIVTNSALSGPAARVTYAALGPLARDAVMNAPLPSGRPIALDAPWSGLGRVDVTIAGLSRASIDAATALQSVASCSMRLRCVDDLRTGRARLITSTLVAAAAQYQFRDTTGVPRDAFAQRLPAAGIRLAAPGIARAIEPLVVGTQAVAASALATLPMCAVPVAFEASGTAETAISGRGSRGAFGDQRASQPLGTIAQLFAQGNEVSDCEPDLGREKSRGYAQAQVEQTATGGLRLSGEIRATSGRYRIGRCTAGQRLPADATLINSAIASVRIAAALNVLVRYEQNVHIDLRWTDMPAGTSLRVLGPEGQALTTDQVIVGKGNLQLRVPGPGVFRVLPTVDARLERKGEAGVKSFSFSATVEAVVTPIAATAAG